VISFRCDAWRHWAFDHHSSGALHISSCLHGVGVTLSGAHRTLDLLLAEPFIRRYEIPTEDRKDRHRAKDDAGKVKRGGRHREVERGDHNLSSHPRRQPHYPITSPARNNGHMPNKGDETHRKDEPVEEHGREVHRSRPASEVKMRRLEGVRGEREA